MAHRRVNRGADGTDGLPSCLGMAHGAGCAEGPRGQLCRGLIIKLSPILNYDKGYSLGSNGGQIFLLWQTRLVTGGRPALGSRHGAEKMGSKSAWQHQWGPPLCNSSQRPGTQPFWCPAQLGPSSSVPLTANSFGEAGLPSLGAFSMVVTSPYMKNTHVLVKSPPFYTPKCTYQYFKFLSKEHGILLPRRLGFLDK